MYIHRTIDIELEKWKAESKRKPLLIRGAREVGKTKTIREFGKNFEHFIEINFEETPRLKALFLNDLSPSAICENIAAIYKTAIVPGETLQSLFLFLKEKKLKKGIRVSNENFSVYDDIEVYPLYAVENLREG